MNRINRDHVRANLSVKVVDVRRLKNVFIICVRHRRYDISVRKSDYLEVR